LLKLNLNQEENGKLPLEFLRCEFDVDWSRERSSGVSRQFDEARRNYWILSN